MFRVFSTTCRRLTPIVLMCALSASPSRAQQPDRPWALAVSKTAPVTIDLRAQEAPLADVAADLSKQLGIPVKVTPALRDTKITVQFERRVLEEVLPLFVPGAFAYADYELTAANRAPRPLAIYLQADTEQQPPQPSAGASAEIHVVSGHTEDERSNGSDEALSVKTDNGQLVVQARRQPFIAVIYAIGGALNASVSIGDQTPDFQRILTAAVDVNIPGGPIDAALLDLSPGIKLYVRRDLTTQEVRVIRIMITDPQASKN